jgi:hypothetical protein
VPTSKSRAEYMADRRAKLRAVEAAEHFDQVTAEHFDQVTAEESPKKQGYDCGCRPGDKCMSHAIQAMSQQRIDAILKEINHR